MAGPWLAKEQGEVVEHIRAGGVDDALPAILRELAAEAGGAFVGLAPAIVGINPGEDRLGGGNDLLCGPLGRGTVRDEDNAGRVVLPRNAEGLFNVGSKGQVPSGKFLLVEGVERLDIPAKLVDSRSRLQRMGETQETLPENVAAGWAGWVARVQMGAHGTGEVT